MPLQLTMLRTQASNLQGGRLSNAIVVDGGGSGGGDGIGGSGSSGGEVKNGGGSGSVTSFTVSYWGAPAPSAQHAQRAACKIHISLPGGRSNSKALCIQHSPALVRPDGSPHRGNRWGE